MPKAQAVRRLEVVAKQSPDIAAFRKLVRGKSGGANAYTTLLGLPSLKTPELLKRVASGFPYGVFERFQANIELSIEALAALVQIKRRTLARRREEGRLTAEESDRLLRAARVFGRALALFEGDVDAARDWFATPAPALGNRTPRDLAATELGVREVENLLGRLEHGVFP